MQILINGSQKNKISNSKYFLDFISKKLDDYKIVDLKNKTDLNSIACEILNSDTVLLAFPLYVDSPTSLILELLDYIYDNNIDISNKQIYTVINCGFREGKQNITALNIIKNFCIKTKSNYMGSILIGAGEIVGKSKYKIICRKAINNLKKFRNKVVCKEICGDIVTTMDLLNNNMYIGLANKSWTKQGKSNNLTKSSIKQK